ncbi:MAG TPA: hypothetical protein DF383_08035 [Deltaproteobacteria bacterium]|nr:hypothetical protein [Deltaproteobacteria bacterium]
MTLTETTLLQALSAHPTWMSLQFLAAVTGGTEVEIEPSLAALRQQGRIEWNSAPPGFYRLASGSAEDALDALAPAERAALHRRLADFLTAQPSPDNFAALLSFHHHQIAAACLLERRFNEALALSREALAWAERSADNEILELRLGELADLYFHWGYFQDAEQAYRRALAILESAGGAPQAWVRAAQSLAAALAEQGKYGAALALLETCRGKLDPEKFPLETGVSELQLAQWHIATGGLREAEQNLKAVEDLSASADLSGLQPYLQLQRGKLEVVSGRLAAAFRIFAEAAEGLERQNDLAGKLEVMLSVSAPLLEHSLLREAQSLIGQLAGWEELKEFPALEHSVHLRRLALGAFSGTWAEEDLELLAQDDTKIGRAEDWLLFWFHLSLAARRLGNQTNVEIFLKRARRIADRIAEFLPSELRESFFRRPDVARIVRLTEPSVPTRQKVRARRSTLAGLAEAGTVAPPQAEKDTEK